LLCALIPFSCEQEEVAKVLESSRAATATDDVGISDADIAVAVKVTALFASHPELGRYTAFPDGR
jgi:hypothetical protein